MRISDGPLAVEVDPLDGARIISCTWQNLQVVAPRRHGLTSWGWFAMAPWAGRVGYGKLQTAQGEILLPTDVLPPHAIHGYAIRQAWRLEDVTAASILLSSATPDPYRDGVMQQRIEVRDSSLHWSISYTGGEPMPAWVGLHPWFRRRLSRGEPVRLEFAARTMLETADHLPTGNLLAPSAGPWDDAFTGVNGTPSLRWPGALRLSIETQAPWWVVYNKEDGAICVEPQSSPPDAATLGLAPVIGPGEAVTVAAVFRFTPE